MPDTGQLGTIILKLITDNKEFAEGLKNALQLVAISSTQMKDLMEFKIKAPDFTALDLAVDANQKKISELTKSQQQQAAASVEEGKAAVDAGQKHKQHGESVDTGSKSIQQFRSEQRLQNFVVRESSQALLGLTSAIGFLSLGNKDAEGTTKKVQTSLLAGVSAANGMEFALFGLGNAAKNMNGHLGVTLRNIAGMAGPIAAVVGIGAGLIAFFTQEESHLKEINDRALDGYIKKLSEAGGQSTAFLQKVTASLEAQKSALKSFNDIVKNAPLASVSNQLGGPGNQFAIAQGDVTSSVARAAINEQLEKENAEHDEIVKKLQKEIREQEILNEAIKRANDEILKSGSSVDKLRIEIGNLNDEVAHGDLTAPERQKKIDALALKQKELAEIMKTTQQRETERLTILESQKRMHEATTGQVIQQIDALLQMKLTDQERLTLEQKRYDIIQAEIELEAQRDAKRRASLDAQRDAINQLQGIILESTNEANQKEFDRQIQLEAQRHQKVLNDIDEQSEKYADLGLRQEAIDAETARNRANLDEIERARRQAKFDVEQLARGDSLEAELAAIDQEYNEAERRARDVYTNEAEYARVIAALRIARERETERVQLAVIQRVFGAAQSILTNIVGIAAHLSPEAQEFVDTLQRGIQVVQAILAIIQTINSLTTFFSFLGLQQGGMIGAQHGIIVPGSGDGDKIPILTEPGEAVLNRNAVRMLGGAGMIQTINRNFPRFGSGGMVNHLLGLDAPDIAEYLASGRAGTIPIPVSALGGVNHDEFNVLIDEVRRLRGETRENTRETRDLADRIKFNLPKEIQLKADARELKRVIELDDESNQ
jgi:hypothetical protein